MSISFMYDQSVWGLFAVTVCDIPNDCEQKKTLAKVNIGSCVV